MAEPFANNQRQRRISLDKSSERPQRRERDKNQQKRDFTSSVAGRGDTSGVVSESYQALGAHQTPPVPNKDRGSAVMASQFTGSDPHYTQQLRRGFIDLRASYSEKRRPRNLTYARGDMNAPPALPPPRQTSGIHPHTTAAPGGRSRADAERDGSFHFMHRDAQPPPGYYNDGN